MIWWMIVTSKYRPSSFSFLSTKTEQKIIINQTDSYHYTEKIHITEVAMDMSSTVMLATCVAIIATAWLVIVRLVKKKKIGRYHPVRGTIFHLLLNFNRFHDYLTLLMRTNTTFRILYPDNSEIYTSDPANVEYILKTNFPNYGKGSLHYDILKDLLGDGIFTVDGERWRQQRKISSHEFSTRNLREYSTGVFKSSADKLARTLSQAVASDQIFDIQDMLKKSSMESVMKAVLGVDLDRWKEEGTQFSEAFDRASELTCYRYVDITWRLKKLLNIGSEAALSKCIQVVDKFVYRVIQKKMDQINNDASMSKGDILSSFLELNQTADPKYLKDIILSFIIAGKDTTAAALSWFFYMMCKHPDMQEKIAREADDSTISIDEEALDKMQFLQASLAETLRLYPAVPQDSKVCFSDDTFPDGFSVKKGNMVTYVPYAMGRMEWLWGDNAEEFRPERWLDENGVFRQESAFKFTAFQAGPRVCLGREFAYRQMKVFAGVLLRGFTFRLADEDRGVNYRTTLTLQIDGGLHLRAASRF